MLGSTVANAFEPDGQSLVPRPGVAERVDGAEAATAVEKPCEQSDPPTEIYMHDVVGRIYVGDDSGMEDLYRIFAEGIRFYLCRHLGQQELDDRVHDTFVIVVQAIRKGELREPGRLMGFVRTVARRQVAAHIDQVVHSHQELNLDVGVRVADLSGNPEQNAVFQQKIALILSVFDDLPARDSEILSRFYLDEQSREEICEEMNLSETQFRLLKSRAKARFGELGKRKLAQKPLGSILASHKLGSKVEIRPAFVVRRRVESWHKPKLSLSRDKFAPREGRP